MATLLELQTRVYENLLLGVQLPIPKTDNPQSECGRNIEQIIKNYHDDVKKLNNIKYPTFSHGVDIQDPYTGDWEVKSRQEDGSSYVNIGAITTKELNTCIKYDIPFEDTDFSRYACKHIWSWYDNTYEITRVKIWDMSIHADAYRSAYYELLDYIKAGGPKEPLQTTPNFNKFIEIIANPEDGIYTPKVEETKEMGYFNISKGMCWEPNGIKSSWVLRVNENKLEKLGKVTGRAKQIKQAIEV